MSEIAKGWRNTFLGKRKTFSAKNIFSDLKDPLFDQKMTLLTKKKTIFEQQNTIPNKKITLLTRNIPFLPKKYFSWIQKIPFSQRTVSYTNKKSGIGSPISYNNKRLPINPVDIASLGPFWYLVWKHHRIYVCLFPKLIRFRSDSLGLAWLALRKAP